MKRTYIFDTNIFLTNANSVYEFKNNDIIVPLKVLDEIDKLEDVEMTTPVLKSDRSIVKPAYDTAPIDSNRLGVYFSPSNAINEDIILSIS